MRWGLIARADNTGLGTQTWELFKNLNPSKTMIIDLTVVNRQMGKETKTYLERFESTDTYLVEGFPTYLDWDSFLTDIDLVFTVESPYSYMLYDLAKMRGIKTINQYNYEFLDYFVRPDWSFPDMLAAPSTWHLKEVKRLFGDKTIVTYLPVPVNRYVLPYKKKTSAKKFLHIAGHKTFEDRNGTDILLAALPYIKTRDIEIVIRSLHDIPHIRDTRVKLIRQEADNYWEIFNDEDVLILPRRYGGLTLQLNEAMSRGMVPIMSKTAPQNEFLDPESLVNCHLSKKVFTRNSGAKVLSVDIWETLPTDLAEKIDQLANEPETVERLSEKSNQLADAISWENLRSVYQSTFESLCGK